MKQHWYLVADRSSARIFAQSGVEQAVRLVEELANPEGKLRDSQLKSDRPGKADRNTGPGHHPMTPHQSPSAHVSEVFASKIAEAIERARQEGSFDTLTLVAEPHFLGELRKHLTAQTTNLVRASLEKDLVNVPSNRIMPYLTHVLMVREAV